MLAEADVDHFASAIIRDMDCADVVATTLRVLMRRSHPGTALLSAQLEACLVACEQSYELCAPHASHHDHCQICATATQRCVQTCRELLSSLHR